MFFLIVFERFSKTLKNWIRDHDKTLLRHGEGSYVQCGCKILTPRRMLKKFLLIAKINRWNNSSQNMYGMLWVKVDRLAGKTFFPKKNP